MSKQITMEKFEGFEYIQGGVCAPQGLRQTDFTAV